MISQIFCLPKIGWRVRVFYCVTSVYTFKILRALREAGADPECEERAFVKLMNGEEDGGITYSNPDRRMSVIVITATSSPEEFANSLQHEQRHLERHIAEAIGIDPYSEDAGYLAGDIAMAMFPTAKTFLCECCSKKVRKNLAR